MSQVRCMWHPSVGGLIAPMAIATHTFLKAFKYTQRPAEQGQNELTFKHRRAE